MTENSLMDEILIGVQDVANNNPAPEKCRITRVYDDNIHADIETNNGLIKYVETISNNLSVNNTGILVYLDGEMDNLIVITR